MNEHNMPVVIVADDDTNVADYLRAAFRLAGFEAYTADSAEECIEQIKTIGVNKVDVVAMDGRLASDRASMLIVNIKKLSQNIKIFVIAERHLDEVKTRVLDYGANEFVLKPISTNSVIEKVNSLLLETATDGMPRRSGGIAQ
jgi:DNA-binding response OmpR family regulator